MRFPDPSPEPGVEVSLDLGNPETNHVWKKMAVYRNDSSKDLDPTICEPLIQTVISEIKTELDCIENSIKKKTYSGWYYKSRLEKLRQSLFRNIDLSAYGLTYSRPRNLYELLRLWKDVNDLDKDVSDYGCGSLYAERWIRNVNNILQGVTY